MNSVWDLYQFRPCIYLTGWTAMAYFRFKRDASETHGVNTSAQEMLLSDFAESEDEDCIATSSTFIKTFDTNKCYLNKAPWMTGPWLCFFFGLQHNGDASFARLAGLILKSNDDDDDDDSYMKVGILNTMVPSDMNRSDSDDKRAWMRFTQGDTSVGLTCEKRTIRLV